jgi:hypothetical protein
MINFITKDMFPRLRAQGHNPSETSIPEIRVLDPKNDYLDALLINDNGGAWYTPLFHDATLRGPIENQDYGLLLHEVGGHGIRYGFNRLGVGIRQKFNSTLTKLGEKIGEDFSTPINKVPLKVNEQEMSIVKDVYPQVSRYPKLENLEDKILSE